MTVDNNNNYLLCKLISHTLQENMMKDVSINDVTPYIRFNNELISELHRVL